MSKFVLNEPRGQYLFEIYTSLSYVRVASYTSHTLPYLNIKHLAVKITSKDQQTLTCYAKFIIGNKFTKLVVSGVLFIFLHH